MEYVKDQALATKEKTLIELRQREGRNTMNKEHEHGSVAATSTAAHKPRLFCFDAQLKEWMYNYADLRPWDAHTDVRQCEHDFRIFTRTTQHLPTIGGDTLSASPIDSDTSKTQATNATALVGHRSHSPHQKVSLHHHHQQQQQQQQTQIKPDKHRSQSHNLQHHHYHHNSNNARQQQQQHQQHQQKTDQPQRHRSIAAVASANSSEEATLVATTTAKTMAPLASTSETSICKLNLI